MKTRKFLLIFITLYTILFLGRGLELIGINWLIYPVYFLLFILGILAYREELKDQLALILTKKKEFLKTISLYMVFVFLLSIACNLLSAFIKHSLGLPLQGQNEANIQGALLKNPFLILVISCLIGPIVEEFFFRRFFLGTFLTKFSNWLGIVLTTFLFATLHMHSWALSEWVTAISYIAGGLLLSLLYLRKDKNIWYPIALHCCNNIIAFMVTIFLM